MKPEVHARAASAAAEGPLVHEHLEDGVGIHLGCPAQDRAREIAASYRTNRSCVVHWWQEHCRQDQRCWRLTLLGVTAMDGGLNPASHHGDWRATATCYGSVTGGEPKPERRALP